MGLSDNNLTDALKQKILDAGTGTFTGLFGDLDDIPTFDGEEIAGELKDMGIASTTDISDAVSAHNNSNIAHDNIRNSITALTNRIVNVENLGQFVGSFDTFALLPSNKSDFTLFDATINDFANVRADETMGGARTKYVIIDINSSTGDITWEYDFTYSIDVTGKMDKQPGAVNNNLAVFSNGQVIDGGIAKADLLTTQNTTAITNAEIDAVMAS
jgi:hypothetical protein